jgi:endonuclease YncB( thermonuclease family)
MTVRTVPCTVAEVIAGDTVRLVLRLGWGITVTARCRLAGVLAATVDSDEGARQRQALAAAVRSVSGEGASLTFTSFSVGKDEIAVGQLTVTDAQGGRHDVAAAVFPGDE